MDLMPAAKRRKGASTRVERPRGVASQFRQTDVSDVQEVCACVMGGGKEEVEGGGGRGRNPLSLILGSYGTTLSHYLLNSS